MGRPRLIAFLINLVLSATSVVVVGAETAQSETVSIMSFNVQNLFDTTHDTGKNDFTYLPLEKKQDARHRAICAEIRVEKWRDQCLYWDWNETTLNLKLRALAEAIRQVDKGVGPDILVLQEVENLSILEQLRTDYLGDAGYLPAVLLEGRDLRGVDVAFLSRLESIGTARLHPIPFKGFADERVADTRGILEASFRLPDGQILTGFAVHFPAPFHPVGMREQAYAHLNMLRAQLPPDRAVFAAGDFNTPAAEDLEHALLDRLVRPHWQLGHEFGCPGCRGTYYYAPRDDWSFLDMILWARPPVRAPEPGWHLLQGSAQVANELPAQRTPGDTPKAFSPGEPQGVSDHWPLLVRIEAVRAATPRSMELKMQH